VGRQIGRLLAGTARASSSDLSWKVTRGPAFGNELATVHLDGSELDLTVESAVAPAAFEHRFRALYRRDWHRRGSRSGRTLHGLAAPSIPPAFVQEESRWLVDPVLTG